MFKHIAVKNFSLHLFAHPRHAGDTLVRTTEGDPVSRPRLLDTLTSPRFLAPASSALDSAFAAWNLRRKPRTSAAVLRRALVSTALTQGATIAGVQGARSSLAGQALVEPLSGFRGPVGDVPVRIAAEWIGSPMVTTVNDKLVMVAGPDYEKLTRAEQEKQYRSAVHSWLPPAAAVALGAGAAVSRSVLHRGLVGRRTTVSKGRATALALAMTGAEAALYAGARAVLARRRQERVARERSAH